MSGDAILKVDGIDVFYGVEPDPVRRRRSSVERGQSLALLGRNGAGKSTTMKAIAGLAPPRRGSDHGARRRDPERKPHRIARAGIGFVPEDRQVFPEHRSRTIC